MIDNYGVSGRPRACPWKRWRRGHHHQYLETYMVLTNNLMVLWKYDYRGEARPCCAWHWPPISSGPNLETHAHGYKNNVSNLRYFYKRYAVENRNSSHLSCLTTKYADRWTPSKLARTPWGTHRRISCSASWAYRPNTNKCMFFLVLL